jgi:hypothetical protein
MSVGDIWHSAALGSTRRRAVARIVALGDALQRTVELGGRGGTRLFKDMTKPRRRQEKH